VLDASFRGRERKKYRRSRVWRQWRGSRRHLWITFARPVALFERKTSRFFIDRWKFTGDPRQSRKPRSFIRRNVERIGIVHRTRSRSDERVQPPLVQAVSARAVEPKRPTGTTSDTFSFFNNGRSAVCGY